jgi:hypothetical protein
VRRAGWIRLSQRGAPTCFGVFRYEPNGCIVEHCGHPTANWPYAINTPDGRMIVAPNGRGFRTLKLAMEATEGIRRENESMTSAAQPAVTIPDMAKKKNPAAVALGKRRAATAEPGELSEIGRIGGQIGGEARANSLTKKRRKEIAQQAAAARWGKKKK